MRAWLDLEGIADPDLSDPPRAQDLDTSAGAPPNADVGRARRATSRPIWHLCPLPTHVLTVRRSLPLTPTASERSADSSHRCSLRVRRQRGTMPPFNPTARELFLLTVLLGSLLFFSATFPRNSSSVSDLIRASPFALQDDLDSVPLELETQYTLQALNPPLRWGAEPVPETKIVAHVPGECPLFKAMSVWSAP